MDDVFEEWLNECDKIVTKAILLSIHDLADASWRDYHEDGLTPSQAVESANEDYWDGEYSDYL